MKLIKSVRPAGILSLLFLAGCPIASKPKYADLGLVSVSGKVTLDGSPLTDSTIEFVTESDQTYSYGYLDSNGNYTLNFDSNTEGVIPGEKAIRFRSGKPAGSEESRSGVTDDVDPDATKPATMAVPDCYKSIGKIKATVAGSTSTMNFDLKSDCSTTGSTNL